MTDTKVSRTGFGIARAAGMRGSKAADKTRSSFQMATWSWALASADWRLGVELKYFVRIVEELTVGFRSDVREMVDSKVGVERVGRLLAFTQTELDRRIWFARDLRAGPRI